MIVSPKVGVNAILKSYNVNLSQKRMLSIMLRQNFVHPNITLMGPGSWLPTHISNMEMSTERFPEKKEVIWKV